MKKHDRSFFLGSNAEGRSEQFTQVVAS